MAELCSIPQHLLSAFELQKLELPQFQMEAVTAAISDYGKVSSLVKRSKRYREQKYVKVERLPERVSRSSRTHGNPEYRQVLHDLAQLHASPKGGKLSALSLFSGCGGFSLGFSAGGFEVKGYLEIDQDLRAIYSKNFPSSRFIGADITQVKTETLAQLHRELGPIDVVIGGPPCQGFSLSGKRQVDDPRNTLFKHYLRVVEVMQPKLAVMENVRLLTSMLNDSGSPVKLDIINEFDKHGYEVRLFEINAKDYGVPQHRERVLFSAIRKGLHIRPSAPRPTHGKSDDLFSAQRPFRTFGDACSDLPYLESGEASDDPLHVAVRHPEHVINWLWDVSEGCSAHENAEPSQRPPSGYNTTYKRQVWSEPASTVQTTFGMISGCRNVHPIATRSLTIREAARIQSFPDTYKFTGNLGTIRKGIGNAVPPLLALEIAKYAKQVIESCKNTMPPD